MSIYDIIILLIRIIINREEMLFIKVAMIQMHVTNDKEQNIEHALELIKEVKASGADLAILPEMFSCPYEAVRFPVYAEKEGEPTYLALALAAKTAGIYLAAGSVPEIDQEGRIFNTAYVFDRQGLCIAKHRKMHLFDIDIVGGQRFFESETLTAGDSITVFDTEFGKIGLCICYDIRFPELSRLISLQGAQLLIVPGAFNMTTGPAHWETLFRARALDNQFFTIGVAPARDINSSYTSYGHSIAVSPWGEVLTQLDEKEGFAIIDIDFALNEAIRKQLPLLAHRRKDIYECRTKI